MPLTAGCGLFIIEHVLKEIKKRHKMLSIARMSMHWDIDDLIKHLDHHKQAYNPKVADVIRKKNNIFTTKEFYELLNFKDYQDIDYYADEGATIVHDLNKPLNTKYHRQFDFVVEVGTIEHIFDLKNVMHNIASCVDIGGTVCHLSPLDAYNHGFYNFSLNFFYDFYRANGFTDMKSFLIRSSKNWLKNQNVLAVPFPYTPEEFHINNEITDSEYNKIGLGFIAKKEKHMPKVVVPMQGAYDKERGFENLRDWNVSANQA